MLRPDGVGMAVYLAYRGVPLRRGFEPPLLTKTLRCEGYVGRGSHHEYWSYL